MQFIANNFNQLTSFCIEDCDNQYEDAISNLFKINKNLKILNIEESKFSAKCFLNLNHEKLDKLLLQASSFESSEHLIQVSMTVLEYSFHHKLFLLLLYVVIFYLLYKDRHFFNYIIINFDEITIKI